LKHSKQKSKMIRNIEKTFKKKAMLEKNFESVVQQGLEKNYENPHLQDRKD